jgi:hypothetical protein
MNYDQERIAGLFIEQYNLLNETQYRFETFRKSMFSLPQYQYPAFEIYQITFIQGKTRSPLATDLSVLFRLRRRLIIEVVEPNISRDYAPSTHWSRLVEEIIYPIEKDALDEVVCARVLLIDGSGFGLLSTPELEAYRIRRPEGNTWFKEIWLVHNNENGETGCLQIR